MLDNFMLWCHVHGRNPQENCTECQTAMDANLAGHRQGNCIVSSCFWCAEGTVPRGQSHAV